MSIRLAAVAAVAFALTACALPEHAAAPPATGWADAYEQAIRDASVRAPSWSVPLRSLGDGPTVAVGTFTEYPDPGTSRRDVWVSSPAQLWELCKGKPDPALAIQQILGLPKTDPQPGHQWHVLLFEVGRDSVFRPCPGGLDPAAAPEAPKCLAGKSLDPHLDERTARFLLNQFWTSHHVTFDGAGKTEFGYPWTGMGWTYDWDPDSKTHVGVSEFVVEQGTAVAHVRSVTPAEFCGAAQPPTDAPVPALHAAN